MIAEIIFEAPLNDRNGEWRFIVGQHLLDRNVYDQIARALRGRTGRVIVFGVLRERPAIIVHGPIAEILGHDHPYSTEGGSRNGRLNYFRISYIFSRETKSLPSLPDIANRVREDAVLILGRAYKTLEESGKSLLEPLTCDFHDHPPHHLGAWLLAERSLQNAGTLVRPFIDTDGLIEYLTLPGQRLAQRPADASEVNNEAIFHRYYKRLPLALRTRVETAMSRVRGLTS